jgi:hypothetical protein
MLTNAIAYNKKHMDTDSTGLSKAVYDAAVFLQEKVRVVVSVYFSDRRGYCACVTVILIHYDTIITLSFHSMFCFYYNSFVDFLTSW